MKHIAGLINAGSPTTEGMHIYPACKGSLETGDIASVLVGSGSYNSDAWYAVRSALAGGNRNNWERLSGSTIFNGNNWPGTCFALNLCLK